MLKIARRVRDNLHGTIDLSILEDKVLAHPMVQRLRRIKQTAFLSNVFPCATHTRFEHSLGVMHLSTLAWEKIYANQMRLIQLASHYENFSASEKRRHPSGASLSKSFENFDTIFESDYLKQALRLAALLHDVGHPPFSHSGERFLPTYKAISQLPLPSYIADYVAKKCQSDPQRKVSHEIYSLLFIEQITKDIQQQEPTLSVFIPAQDIASIIVSDIPPMDSSPLAKLKVQALCHEIISSEIDTDRMDYLLRDSSECGVVYGIFDVDRVLDSLCIYHSENDDQLHLALKYSGLAAFEDYLRARQSMYIQLYFHKTSVACEAMLQHFWRESPQKTLPVDILEYAKLDDSNVHSYLSEKENPIFDHLLFKRKLWKKVYEVTLEDESQTSEEILRVKRLLDKCDIPFEEETSQNYLTKFSLHEKEKAHLIDLKLIKKDESMFPCVVPIREHSPICCQKNFVKLIRIYVREQDARLSKRVIFESFEKA